MSYDRYVQKTFGVQRSDLSHKLLEQVTAIETSQKRSAAGASGPEPVDIDDVLFDMEVGQLFRSVFIGIVLHLICPAAIQNGVVTKTGELYFPVLDAMIETLSKASQEDSAGLRRELIQDGIAVTTFKRHRSIAAPLLNYWVELGIPLGKGYYDDMENRVGLTLTRPVSMN